MSKANKRKDDINIENFNLKIVTSDRALSPCTEDKTKAEAAFVQTITAANKLVAHSTEMVDLGGDEVNSYLIYCNAIPVLFNLYFYEPLRIEFPKIDLSSRPSTRDAVAERLTPEGRSEAQRRAREWDAAHPREP